MLTALAFIFTLGLLVTVHEYGHFQVAKWCGVKVLKFSIGFGKPLWSKKFGQDQSEFIIAAIPLGGYVKMLDEREFDQESQPTQYSEVDLKRAFNRQSVYKRIAIVLAGPMANLLLAIFLYWVLFMLGIVGLKPVVGKVADHSPAAVAGFSIGETIQKVNGKNAATWQEVSWGLLNISLKNKVVAVQTLSNNQEIHTHQLNLSKLNLEEANKDVMASLGLAAYQPNIPARIGEIIKNSPADLANLKTNDLVLNVNYNKIDVWQEFVQEVRSHPNIPLDILVKRDSEELRLTLRPEAVVENGQTIGRIGAAFKMEQNALDQIFITTRYSVGAALVKATEKTWDTVIFSLQMLGKMVTGQLSLKGMSGPFTIADYAGQSAQIGIKAFLGFLALISISLCVLNLLPIPVLDGGHFMYYIVEILTGKPVSESIMMIGQKIGFLLLGFMMIIALYNDINRLITG